MRGVCFLNARDYFGFEASVPFDGGVRVAPHSTQPAPQWAASSAVHTLAHEWDVPVYAHELELPYLTGQSAYPPPDPLVGGGAMSLMSALFPKRPIDLGRHVLELPADGSVPGAPGWRWIPPGPPPRQKMNQGFHPTA